MTSYPILTITSGSVFNGAVVEKLTLKGADTTIPAILIGEEGRGRQRGVLPVALTPSQNTEWQAKGRVIINFAELSTSGSGKPKLIAKDKAENSDKFISVFMTGIGFRGGNDHTGDRGETTYQLSYNAKQMVLSSFGFSPELNNQLNKKATSAEIEKLKSEFNLSDEVFEPELTFLPFPGQVLIEGRIAQGDAGNMGSGKQMVALMPKGVWFRTGYSGRLYGKPAAHYYLWNGAKLVAVTWDDRQNLDSFEKSPIVTEEVTNYPVQDVTAPQKEANIIDDLKLALELNSQPDIEIDNQGNVVLTFGAFRGKKFTIVGGEIQKS